MQYFKGDPIEKKFDEAAAPTTTALEIQKDLFFEGAFSCFILGELLYDTNRAPLANAIPREIFRESFASVFEAFITAGSFESYLTVFRNVFGNEVEVTFEVPGPGKLNINIVATGFKLSYFNARRIENDAYVFSRVITQDGNYIMFQTVKGFESEYELKQMLFEMVPNGIYTNITLSIEGE